MVAKIKNRIAAFLASVAMFLIGRILTMRDRAQMWTLPAPGMSMLARPQRGIGVIDMVVGMLIIIAVLPTVITDWFNVQTTNWGAAGTIWDLAPLLAIVGLLIWFRQRKSGGVSGGI